MSDNSIVVAAIERLKAANPEILSQMSGCSYNKQTKVFESKYIGRPCAISHENGEITPIGYEKTFNVYEKIILLRHILDFVACEPTGKYIGYRQLNIRGIGTIAGAHDLSTLTFEQKFGNSPKLLYTVLDKISGVISNVGDASITIEALPGVLITYAIWEGEDNIIPPGSKVLYDSSLTAYPHGEDIAEIATFVLRDIVDAC